MRKLDKCKKLNSQVKIYVPSTSNIVNEIDNTEWVNKTLEFLSNIFEGATTTKALGAWVTQKGKLIKEKVDLCFSFSTQKLLDKYIDEIYEFCLSMKLSLKQENIGLEVNGEFYLV